MSNKKKTINSRKSWIIPAIIIGLVVIFLGGKSLLSGKSSTKEGQNNQINLSENGDLVIPLAGISEKASFYPVDIDGTKIEVLAVKAPDGSVRTAFNTCQVCFSSGRGYYIQQGDKLVCQNCGNQFSTSDVEVSKNGCNPVPITEQDKTVDSQNITISNQFLTQYKVIFENWKNEF